jgi:hypothetical protein
MNWRNINGHSVPIRSAAERDVNMINRLFLNDKVTSEKSKNVSGQVPKTVTKQVPKSQQKE